MHNVTLKVTWMSCDGCVRTVRQALSVVQGVHRAGVSLDQGRADLLTEDEVDVEDLVTAVKNAGYDVAESG